jgi:hypothetical protein
LIFCTTLATTLYRLSKRQDSKTLLVCFRNVLLYMLVSKSGTVPANFGKPELIAQA